MTLATNTRMYSEAREAAAGVRQQAESHPAILTRLRHRASSAGIQLIAVCARGSSDHAGLFAKYIFQRELKLPVISVTPSLASVHRLDLTLPTTLFLAISQSGESPDILRSTESAARSGAITACIVNQLDSPLANSCDFVIPMEAGPEHSVAATKSFICSLAAVCSVANTLSGTAGPAHVGETLPALLTQAADLDWRVLSDALLESSNLFVLGRDVSFAIANEAALKLKETCALHAEAYSAAEVQHGPMELINEVFPVLVFNAEPGAANGIAKVLDIVTAAGARGFAAGMQWPGVTTLPTITTGLPYVDAILQVQSFYLMANELSVAKGRDPDAPRRLQKITATL